MARLDRLSALVARFAIEVGCAKSTEANLAIYQQEQSSAPDLVMFTPSGTLATEAPCTKKALFLAKANWGGRDNPLLLALPAEIKLDIRSDQEMQHLASLLISENTQRRCGAESVINRLGEVLLIRLLRRQLSSGNTDIGLLGGLADARLSAAIVAMHEHPGKQWRIEHLAEVAGLSASRFADRFTHTVGQTPMAYLRHWRMVLAHQDVRQGDRIQTVAHRYGYASSEALSRAFRRHFGNNPSESKKLLHSST